MRAGVAASSEFLDLDDGSGVVMNSDWVVTLERQTRVHPRQDSSGYAGIHHLVVQCKNSTLQAVRRTIRLHRHPGPPIGAAAAVLTRRPERRLRSSRCEG